MPAPVTITAVVVTWNAQPLLEPCLRALLDQQVPAARYRVWLVDNGSEDDTVAWCEATLPDVTVLRSPRNLGFAGGADLALRRLLDEPGDGVAVLVNNDAVVEPGFVRELVATIGSAPDVAAATATIVLAGGFVDDPTGEWRRRDGRRFRRVADGGTTLVNSTGVEMRTDGNGQDRDWLTPLDALAAAPEVFGFCGGACALRVAALREVGVFADEFFLYYEDTDLSWRLRLSGWHVRYAPAAVAVHRHAASSGTGSQVFALHNQRNRLLTLVRNAELRLVLVGAARFAVASVVAGARDRASLRLRVRVAVGFVRLLPWAVRTRTRVTRAQRTEVQRLFVRGRPDALSG